MIDVEDVTVAVDRLKVSDVFDQTRSATIEVEAGLPQRSSKGLNEVVTGLEDDSPAEAKCSHC